MTPPLGNRSWSKVIPMLGDAIKNGGEGTWCWRRSVSVENWRQGGRRKTSDPAIG